MLNEGRYIVRAKFVSASPSSTQSEITKITLDEVSFDLRDRSTHVLLPVQIEFKKASSEVAAQPWTAFLLLVIVILGFLFHDFLIQSARAIFMRYLGQAPSDDITKSKKSR